MTRDQATLSTQELASGGNRLLAAMADDDLAMLGRRARRDTLARGEFLSRADQPAPAAYFIESGVASVVRPADDRRTEIGILGPEGFTGSALVMADGRWPYETFIQTEEARAVRIEAARFTACFARSASLRTILLAAVHIQSIQIAESLFSAAWQRINARLARWLLMYRDRVCSPRLEVTHEFMALMIGAQRTGITKALHELESEGAIIATRGCVTIRDARKLEAAADGGYGTSESEAARLL